MCKNHGEHLRFSVFECDLDATELTGLQRELLEVISSTEDQVLFVYLGPADGRAVRSRSRQQSQPFFSDARADPEKFSDLSQTSATKDLKDFFVFTKGQPTMGLDAAPEGGSRYPITASMAGRLFTKFHLDVGIGDVAIQPTELLEGRNWLGFAGIHPTNFLAISKEQQFAEKLHAYTFPRLERPNSGVKDLVDIALLLRLGTMDLERLKEAIRITFALRNTHAFPVPFPEPPTSWSVPFRTLAAECSLDWTLLEAIQRTETFLSEAMSR